MDPIQKNQMMMGLLFIFAGIIGIIFYLLYPFDHLTSIVDFALIVSLIILIMGLIFLPLGIAKKSPFSTDWSLFLIVVFGVTGTLLFIIFGLHPFTVTPTFVLGILNCEFSGYQLWRFILHRRQKKMESSGPSK